MDSASQAALQTRVFEYSRRTQLQITIDGKHEADQYTDNRMLHIKAVESSVIPATRFVGFLISYVGGDPGLIPIGGAKNIRRTHNKSMEVECNTQDTYCFTQGESGLKTRKGITECRRSTAEEPWRPLCPREGDHYTNILRDGMAAAKLQASRRRSRSR